MRHPVAMTTIPSDVVERAKQCITDTIAAIIVRATTCLGAGSIVAFAEKNGAGGKSRILGPGGARVHAPAAALANGALAHAFEMDNPDLAEHRRASGRDAARSRRLPSPRSAAIGGRELIAAVVAGAEVMIRIGRATHAQQRGVAASTRPAPPARSARRSPAGRLMGFDAERMRNALGIAGSLVLRADGVRPLRHRRDGEAAASRARRPRAACWRRASPPTASPVR